MLSRRNFLRILAGAAAAPAVSYFLPPIGGWKSDIIVHPSDPTSFESVNAAQELSKRIIIVSNPSGPSWVKERFLAPPIPPELWGLAYYVTKPPYISDEYMGIRRHPVAKPGAAVLPLVA